MLYKVKNCVCDYSVVRVIYDKNNNKKEEIVDILNSRTNAQLICDILNADLHNEVYTLPR